MSKREGAVFLVGEAKTLAAMIECGRWRSRSEARRELVQSEGRPDLKREIERAVIAFRKLEAFRE